MVVLISFMAGCSGEKQETPTPATPPSNQSGALLGSSGDDPERRDLTIYQVVVNHEEQYSIWPANRELPLGWNSIGFIGGKTACLQYIQDLWFDMRPTPLRPTVTTHIIKYQIIVNQKEPKLKCVIWDMAAEDGFPDGYSAEGYTGIDSDCITYIRNHNPK